MTGAQSLELRGLAGVVCSVFSAVAWTVAPRIRTDRARFRRLAVAAFALSRLSLFLVAFWVFHLQPRGDIELYMQEAAPAYAGQLVYRDFATPHAPLSPYMFAAMLHLRYDPRVIILFASLFDLAAFALWMRYSARLQDALTERRAALLMLFNPVSLITVAIDGQMNSLIALGLAWSAVAVFEQRDAIAGFAAAVPGVLVKFLSWVFAPSLFAASRCKAAWSVGFVALTLAVYGTFAAHGANILAPLGAEGAHKTTSNITFLVELLTGINLGNRLPDLMLALVWIAVVALTFWAMHRREGDEIASRKIVLVSLIAVMMTLQVFSKNTWDRYLVMTMYPLCYLAAEFTGAQIALYCVWLVVNVTYRSFWATFADRTTSVELHRALMQHGILAHQLLVGEVLQTGGNMAIFTLAVRKLLRLASVADDSSA